MGLFSHWAIVGKYLRYSDKVEITGQYRVARLDKFKTVCYTSRMARDKQKYNDYLNNYMKQRWDHRRRKAVEKLGGVCVVCKSTDGLEFDHIDPQTKSMSIARASSRNEEFFWNEVSKCQLLCKKHHLEKTSSEQGVKHGEGLTGKKNCRCDLCRPLKNEYSRLQKLKKNTPV